MNNHSIQHEAEPWQPHLQTLHRTFYESANDLCLMWVNPAQGDPFADDPLVEERRVGVPIQHPNFDTAFAPYLVELDLGQSRDADVFKRSVAMAWNAWELDSLIAFNGQTIGGWISSDQSAQTLAQHWAKNCHIHSIKGLTKLLRFHDPSPREWLWRVLTPLQQTRLLGSASFIVAFNREQELMTHSISRSVVNEEASCCSHRRNGARSMTTLSCTGRGFARGISCLYRLVRREREMPGNNLFFMRFAPLAHTG
jgi:hypothetical protein